jgi:hypothetical protein
VTISVLEARAVTQVFDQGSGRLGSMLTALSHK